MKYKFLAAICAIMVLLSGCSMNDKNLKDNIIDSYNSLIKNFSKQALTKDKTLQGDRETDTDEYTGTYTADYNNFTGKEFIFGGTALERQNGNQLKVTYTLNIDKGKAKLYWIKGNEKHIIANNSSEDVKEYTLSAGDNYIVLKGTNFKGTLELKVEDS